MKKTTRKKLNLLSHGDYMNRWDTPINDNFEKIDDEFQDLAKELIGSETGEYDGALRGNKPSLADRLNTGLDANGNILFNNDDLNKSMVSKKQWNSIPRTINDRLNVLDMEDANHARLAQSLSGGSGIAPYIGFINDYSNPSDVLEKRKYSSTNVALENFHFRNKTSEQLFSVNTVFKTVDVNPLGLMQIDGVLFHHTVPFSFVYTSGSYGIYLYASNLENTGIGAQLVNCQKIRKSSNSGQSLGTFTKGTNIFYATNIGASSTTNNNWMPSKGQILRLFFSGYYRDYKIETVSQDSIEIFGEFEEDNTSGIEWEIFDFTQPVFYVIEPSSELSTKDVMRYIYGRTFLLLIAIISPHISSARVSFPSFIKTDTSNYHLIDHITGLLYHTNGGLGTDGDLESITINLPDVSVPSIKSAHVIVVERSVSNPNVFYISIDPKRWGIVSLGGVSAEIFVPSFDIRFQQEIVAGNTPVSYSDQSVKMTLYHPLDAYFGFYYLWSFWNGDSAKTLEYLGILLEVA